MNLVAITACPTGIAHSQMAAEKLRTTADNRGYEIHVEIQGAMGTENEIPNETLNTADAVIIAADTSIKMDRFSDHVVVNASVKDGVNDADRLIDEAINRAGGDTDTEVNAPSSGDTKPINEATDSIDGGDNEADPTSSAATESSEPDSSNAGVIARLKRLFS